MPSELKPPLGIKLIAWYWIVAACASLVALVKDIYVLASPPLSTPVLELNKGMPLMPLLVWGAVIPSHFAAAYGLLSLRRWGYQLAVAMSIVKVILLTLSLGADLISLVSGAVLSRLEQIAAYSMALEWLLTLITLIYFLRKATRHAFMLTQR